MNLVLLSPHWLWLLLLLPLVPLVKAEARVPAHALLRALLLLLLVLALAQPALRVADARQHAVFVVDATASAAAAALERSGQALRTVLQQLPGDVEPSVVLLGAAPQLGDLVPAPVRVQGRGTPLSAALSAALLQIPDGARGSVTLLSDGLATDPHFGDALLALQQRGIPLHTLRLDGAEHAPEPASLTAQGTPRAGHSVELRVELVGRDGPAHVTVRAGDAAIGAADAVLQGGHGSARIAWEPPTAGFVAVTAQVGAQQLARTFAVQEPLRGLYIGKRVAHGRDDLQRLVGGGVQLDDFQANDGALLPNLSRYDVVVLDDAPADQLGADNQRQLQAAVSQRGLGLFACGGEAMFGPGGYHKSELDKLLPVESVQKEEKRDPSTTLVLIIDTSGSMGGERVQLAKEVARLAMARLLPHDKVGIVEFYGAKRWAAPIQPASNMIDLARAINRMDAGGGTVIMPAIEEAYYGLQNVQTRYKHVLILTDAGVETGAFEPLLRRMADDGVNVSTVLVGPEAHSEFLVDVANWGKGRFYAVPDRFNLPELLFKQPTNSRLPAYKPGRFPVDARGGSGWWGRVDRRALPELAGYCETMARPGAEVLVEVKGERDPVLATWCYGLGRVTALCTEPCGPGTATWRDWPGYAPLMARVLCRTADDLRQPFRYTLLRRGAELELLAERRGGGLEVPAVVRLDDAGAPGPELPLQQRAPGVFLARWTAPPGDEQRLLAKVGGDAQLPVFRLCSNAFDDERGELAVAGGLDLAGAAASTGGQVLRPEQLAAFVPTAGGGALPGRLAELAPWLLAAALLLFLSEIFHRRRDANSPA